MKKRIFCIAAALLSLLLLFCFAACGNGNTTEPSAPEQNGEEEKEKDIPLEPEIDPNLRPELNPAAGKAA